MSATATVSASPTRVWREEQSLRSSGLGQVHGDMPHNWASAELIRLVRNLLVFERDNCLELLAGVPEEWLTERGPIRIEATPTRFGRVSLEVETRQDRLVVRVSRAAGLEEPDACLLRLPRRFRSKVCIDGHEAVAPAPDGLVQLPLDQNGITVEAF
jgi:hypothetical protein